MLVQKISLYYLFIITIFLILNNTFIYKKGVKNVRVKKKSRV